VGAGKKSFLERKEKFKGSITGIKNLEKLRDKTKTKRGVPFVREKEALKRFLGWKNAEWGNKLSHASPEGKG